MVVISKTHGTEKSTQTSNLMAAFESTLPVFRSLKISHLERTKLFIFEEIIYHCLDTVGPSTSHNPMGLHGLVQG
jgi:hypothetical protein